MAQSSLLISQSPSLFFNFVQVIELDHSDDIVSVCDRLLWAADPRVLFVLPAVGEVLGRGIDLLRLRRCADGLHMDVALVYDGRETAAQQQWARQAWGLGVPVFASVAAARRGRRRWRPRRKERLGLLTQDGWAWPDGFGDSGLRNADFGLGAYAQVGATATGRRWLSRLGAVLLAVVIIVAGVLAALALIVPTATITVQPVQRPVESSRSLMADPAQVLAVSDSIIPAQTITQTVNWSAVMDIDAQVTADDREQLRAQTLETLRSAAKDEINGRLPATMILLGDSLQIIEVQNVAYSAAAGETAERLVLSVQATVGATAVESALVNGLVYEQLVAAVPPGYVLDPDSLQMGELFLLGEDSAGRMTFRVDSRALATARIDVEPYRTVLSGQSVTGATTLLAAQLPLADAPWIEVRPQWWAERIGRLPFRATQIEIRVVE